MERHSERPVMMLLRLPRWIPPVLLAVFLLAGLTLPGLLGLLGMLPVLLFTLWLGYLSWPRLTRRARLLRLGLFGLFVGCLVAGAVGRM